MARVAGCMVEYLVALGQLRPGNDKADDHDMTDLFRTLFQKSNSVYFLVIQRLVGTEGLNPGAMKKG